MDPRKGYLISCIRSLLNLPDEPQSLAKSPILDNLLNKNDQQSLHLLYIPNKGFKPYKFADSTQPADSLIISIVKVANEPITEDNMIRCLSVSLMPSNPMSVLQKQLEQFFLPALKGVVKDPNIQRLLNELKSGMDQQMAGGGYLQQDMGIQDQMDVSAVHKPSDEFDYWTQALNYASSSAATKRIKQINEQFASIDKQWRDLKSVELNGFRELVDQTCAAMDTIWMMEAAEPYPEVRMRKFIEVSSSALTQRIQTEFQGSAGGGIWDLAAGNAVRLQLGEASRTLKYWSDSVGKYTQDLWRQQIQGRPAWSQGGNDANENLFKSSNSLAQRINELNDVRSQLEELKKASRSGALKMDVNQIVEGLKQVCGNALSASQQQWDQAKAQLNTSLESMEEEIVQFLKQDVFMGGGSGVKGGQKQQQASSNPTHTLREMQAWQGLLNREGVRKRLQSERSAILVSLISIATKLIEEFETRSGQTLDQIANMGGDGADAIPSGHNFSKSVNSLIWARQLNGKIKKLQVASMNTLSDLKEHGGFKELTDGSLGQIKNFETEQFESWRQEITGILKQPDNELYLQMSGKMMELDLNGEGLLKVNYSERLVLLIREVRQLVELGYKAKIPKPIQDVVEMGKQFYKEALTLKQVASFYNSMSSQILTSQKQMMIDQVIKFEEVVKNTKLTKKPTKMPQQFSGSSQAAGGTITWDNAEELEQYITRVQDAANGIMNENRRLRKLHLKLVEIVSGLFEVDLIKQKHVWRDKVDLISRTIDLGCQSKDPKLCKTWRQHWDIQLYKALEHQYQRGMQTLDSQLPEMNADIVLKGCNIQFRPPLEELKEKYYTEVRNFINWPATNFTGVSGGAGRSEIFQAMPARNSSHLTVVYAKCEELFAKLQNLLEVFRPWTALGYLNFQSLTGGGQKKIKVAAAVSVDNDDEEGSEMGQLMKSLEDWEYNIKNIRVKRKELEKINENYKVECFSVSVTPFKQSADDLLQGLVDQLTGALRTQVKQDAEKVEEFVNSALERLKAKPATMEQMNQAKTDYFELKGQKKEFEHRLQEAQAKNKLLRNLGGQASSNLSSAEKRWENFEMAIGDFDNILSEQMGQMKQDIGRRSNKANADMEKFYQRWSALRPKQSEELDKESARDLALKMKDWRSEWAEIEKTVETILKDCDTFNMTNEAEGRPSFPSMAAVQAELREQEELWSLFDQFSSELEVFEKEDWLGFRPRLFTFQDFLMKWTDLLKQNGSGRSSQQKKDAVTLYLYNQVDLFKQAWPGLKLCTGEAFEKDHWRDLLTMLKVAKEVKLETLRLGNLLDSDRMIVQKMNELKELSARAVGEVTLREAVQELKTWCDTAVFDLTEYTSNGRTTPLIREWKDMMTKVGDNQSLLASLKESKYYKRFAEQIEGFETKLGGIDEYLQKLNVIQRKWVYLEPIFGRGALPQEQPRFRRLDDDFRAIMLGLQRDPKIVNLAAIAGIKDTLETILDQLERCQKALNDFLEEKRGKFPRFYFLGDDDLLEILGQSQNAAVIQMHLKKLFAGINKVEFNKDTTQILAMISSAEEVVPLREKIQVEELVENWLSVLSKVMQSTLQEQLGFCLKESQLEPNKYPSQILCLAEELRFTSKAVSAVQGGKLEQCRSDLAAMLENLTRLVGGATLLVQLKLKAMILDLIHHIEVVDLLIQHGVNNLLDWHWYKQLKYELNAKRLSEIIMCKARFDYTYEYQGNAPKLVHTPLTDKCYLTLTQGMDMGYGGNPYGPAGTGKTESVKALGQAFGRQVLVFNCDEGLDFKSMGRIFIGLVKCGAWGCFDEFNRLLEEQLSAISQQIQVIQWAIKEREQTMQLLGHTIEVNKNSGIFVTLNPAGKGYGGRSKLPDNLKQLFRPVAMSVPDNELIAETLLYAEGFKNAKELAAKVISIFVLARQLLSQQQHYDWGLRALKTILTVAGQLIQTERAKAPNTQVSKTGESELLIKAIRINTMSKLTFSDMNKFVALMSDVFPGVKCEDIVYEQLTAAVKEVLSEMKLDAIETQIAKILQFYEATKQRMGVVIVGPSGCGKTTIWKVLKRATEKLGTAVKTYIMNPKSMPRAQLLGLMNNDTREFTEGVLTSSARAVVKDSAEVISWIICDGDIDPEWIESLNSVLDDNHLLTLPTGERISFGANVNFIFETSDLQFASPATVSRMGMIFLNTEDISVKAVVNRWVKRMAPSQDAGKPGATGTGAGANAPQGQGQLAAKLETWMEEFFYQILDWVCQQQMEEQQLVATTRVGLILNVLSQLQEANIAVQSRYHFACLMLRGFASNFGLKERGRLAQYIFELTGEKPPGDVQRSPLDFSVQSAGIKALTPSTQELQGSGDFTDAEEPPVIRTIGLQRDLEILRPWIAHCEPFIVCGPEGCGKSLLIRAAFNELKGSQKILVATIYCNAQTTAAQVIQKLNQVCTKGTIAQGRVLKPKDCSRLVVYLKDINLPKPDKYNTIQLIAFLQQMITHRGFYDESLEFIYLDEKIQLVASMAPSSTVGRHELATRFTANVRILYVDYPSAEELQSVYAEYARAIFQTTRFKMDKQQAGGLAKKVSTFFAEFYQLVRTKFSIDEQRHYIFTPRSLTQIIYGIMRYDASTAEGAGKDALISEALCNEVSRAFRDRLVNYEARSKFDSLLAGLMKQHLGQQQQQQQQQAFFSSMGGQRTLLRMEKKDYIHALQQSLLAYEREFTEMPLHLLDEVLYTMSALDRALSMPGSILLAGRAGIGRKSCVGLASLMLRLEKVQPATTRDYSLREFKKDLKVFMEIAAVQNKAIVLFIEDHNLARPEFLELLNSLISSGEIPGLYSMDEVEHAFANPEEVRREYYGKTMYEIFCARVKMNLRVVLSMNPTKENFTSNCAANPALFAKCTVIWNEQWGRESMVTIVREELKDILGVQQAQGQGDAASGNIVSGGSNDGTLILLANAKEREDLLNNFAAMHKSTFEFQTAVQPMHYFALCATYKKILERKVNSRGNQASHLKKGLQKLQEATSLVDVLKKEAQVKKQELARKQTEADEALVKISKAMQDAAERKQETEQLQQFLSNEEGKIKGSKVKVEEELKDVQPIIDAARQAVQGISKSNLDWLRSLKMPPEPIHDVMKGVLRIFGNYDTSWNSMKKFLAQRTVIESILDFDPRVLNAQVRSEVEQIIQEHSNSFEEQVIYRASPAAGPLADWVKATLKYATVLEKIKPLEEQLSKLDKKLESSRARLKECESQLAQIVSRVDELKRNFADKTSEAEILKTGLRKAEETLGIAQNLVDKLGDEKVRWEAQARAIDTEFKGFPAESLLAAGVVTYLSDADENQRDKIIKQWRQAFSKASNTGTAFDFLKFMTTESNILRWKSAGLPGDSLTLENSVMIFASTRTPLLIDPNLQATEWLKRNVHAESEAAELTVSTQNQQQQSHQRQGSKISNSGAQKGGGGGGGGTEGQVETLNQQDEKFTNKLELSVRFGKTLVIQELDNIEAILIPILRKDLLKQGPRMVVNIGDKLVDYSATFHLFLCTRNSAIDIQPHAAALISIINYTVTKSGLEGKLLSIIINHEQPDIEKKKQELLENEERLKIQLADLEKTLLEELADSQGNILENKVLIDSLNQTKQKSNIIAKSLQESSMLQENLDKQREVYRSLADKGATIFILMNDLRKVNNMYRFSLAYFVSLFQKCLNESQTGSNDNDGEGNNGGGGVDMQQKLEYCAKTLNKIIFNAVASSLFKCDRMMFGLHLTHGIMPQLFEKGEWEFLLLGAASSAISGGSRIISDAGGINAPKWAPIESKEPFAAFLQSFPKSSQIINFNDREWESWSHELECERNFPASYKQKLTKFQKVLLVSIFRPERLQSALNQFVCEALGLPSTAGTPPSFKTIYTSETTPMTPTLFVVSAGSDPSKELEEFAATEIGRENFQELSMGGNQNELALQMLRQAANKGIWVCFKNLHLVTSWLPTLEKELKQLSPHKNFRLWLTTEQHSKFPAILLETCFKISYEAPPGVKKNLQRIYSNWQNSINFKGIPPLHCQMLFILAWFHALIQERRTYIPQGWSKFYEFSYGDLRAGETIIEALVKDAGQKQINWTTLYGLFENAIYGGRIDGLFDLKVLRAYLQRYFSQQMLTGENKLSTQQDVPATQNLKDFIMLISKLPEVDSPNIFGLPLNIDKAVQRYNSQQVIGSLKVIMQVSEEDVKFDKEKWAAALGPIINLWKQLYAHFKQGGGLPQIKQAQLNSTEPIDSFVYLEAFSAYQMLEKIEQSIDGLNRVLFGNGLLTSDIQATGLELLRGQVPVKWQALWDGSENPSSWLKGFCKRVSSLKKWVERTSQKQLLEDELNLSELFHSEVFLNALRQKTARKLTKPLNELKLSTSFEADKLKGSIVVKIKGLLLQGCMLDQAKLIDGVADMPEYITAPILYLCYIPNSDPDPYPSNILGEFPLFTNSSREKLLIKLILPNLGNLQDRIISGVAFFLAEN